MSAGNSNTVAQPKSIAEKLANENGSTPVVAPLRIDRDCASHMRVFRPLEASKHTLLMCDCEKYNAQTNVANLRTLEQRIRDADLCRRHLHRRMHDTERLAMLMSRNNYSISDVANRYGKRARMRGQMPAAFYGYYRACQKYDEAKAATLRRESPEKVAKLVAQGLEKADSAISTVEATLKAEQEKPLPTNDSN